jgi:hypothetical protein
VTNEEFESSFEELVDFGYLEPVATTPDGKVKYRLAEKGTNPPRPQWGTGIRIAENDQIEVVFSSRERDLVLFKTHLENEALYGRFDAARWNETTDHYTVPLTLMEIEDVMESLVTAIHHTSDSDRQLRIELSRFNDRLVRIDAQYDLIFSDDMSFLENW